MNKYNDGIIEVESEEEAKEKAINNSTSDDIEDWETKSSGIEINKLD